jgi:glycine/D-amino acid oxidase-like deaminating enzyme
LRTVQWAQIAGVQSKAADTVVLAAGAWSALFCQHHDIDLAAINVIGTALRTAEAPGVIEGCFSGPNFALRRRLDGGYTIAVPGYGRVELYPKPDAVLDSSVFDDTPITVRHPGQD